jgi:DNA-binding transcriptional regulator YdaS (Cro superfamily)
METVTNIQPSAIERACAVFGWGGQSKLARELSRLGAPCTPQAVQKMCSTGRVPAERVLDIEKLTGVPRHDLRPDLYPTEQAAA